EKFGNLYTAFEEVLKDEKILEKEGFEGKWMEKFIEIAKENIPPPIVEIAGYVEMTCFKSDGIKYIKEALKKMEEKFDGAEARVRYVSAPVYRIEVIAPDYKMAEKIMKQQVEKAIQYIKKHGGTASFKREIK
ncbi:MAG: translation initiation factor IF-2 subunit alpha, partial [Thermoplasmata archaeon]|nr:translation initiation factor IF-2 subunit alpha [Thermoplasmata archaeon]